MRRLPVLLAAILVGCARAPSLSHPEDATLLRLDRAGDVAYGLERSDEAAEQYRGALGRARERDDAAAIADSGFNLAVAQLRAGHAVAALQTARELQAELARRDIVDKGFYLVIATALFRNDDLAGADQAAAGLTTGKTPGLADSAWFLRGLIADRRGDRAGLDRAVASLGTSAEAADVDELRARQTRDSSLALRSADLRRTELDYRGMARSLALAAELTSDRAAAADLFLRAGRSAAAQGDTVQARTWLGEGRRRAPDGQLRAQADLALHDLPREATR